MDPRLSPYILNETCTFRNNMIVQVVFMSYSYSKFCSPTLSLTLTTAANGISEVPRSITPSSVQVILSLFAGTDTTSMTLTRVLQHLATADDGKDIVIKLRQELSNAASSDDDELDDRTGTGSGGASRAGILATFPLLDVVILEAFR